MKRLIALCLAVFFLFSCTEKETRKDDGIVVIALVDTGISTIAIDSSRIIPGYNYVTESEDTEDRINHGTAIASVIAGSGAAKVDGKADFAYLVPLVITDKLDSEIKSVSADTLSRVIRDAIDIYGADIINMSIGVRSDSKSLRDAVEYAEERGVIIIAAAGNEGDDEVQYFPASYESVLSVGSCDKDGNRSFFSPAEADLFALGEDRFLASRNGMQYGMRGTSVAAAEVSAYAATIIKDNSNIPCDELRLMIINKASENGGCLIITRHE